jgi:hypothetical protein
MGHYVGPHVTQSYSTGHPASHRTVNRVLRLSRLTSAVVPLESGRPRLLTAADVSVSNQSSSYAMFASPNRFDDTPCLV